MTMDMQLMDIVPCPPPLPNPTPSPNHCQHTGTVSARNLSIQSAEFQRFCNMSWVHKVLRERFFGWNLKCRLELYEFIRIVYPKDRHRETEVVNTLYKDQTDRTGF